MAFGIRLLNFLSQSVNTKLFSNQASQKGNHFHDYHELISVYQFELSHQLALSSASSPTDTPVPIKTLKSNIIRSGQYLRTPNAAGMGGDIDIANRLIERVESEKARFVEKIPLAL